MADAANWKGGMGNLKQTDLVLPVAFSVGKHARLLHKMHVGRDASETNSYLVG